MIWAGQDLHDLEARSQEREDHPATVAVLALIVGILIGLITADFLHDERPTTTEIVTGRPAAVAATAVEGVDAPNLQEPTP